MSKLDGIVEHLTGVAEAYKAERDQLAARVAELESRLPLYVTKDHLGAVAKSEYARGLEDGRKSSTSKHTLLEAAEARVVELQDSVERLQSILANEQAVTEAQFKPLIEELVEAVEYLEDNISGWSAGYPGTDQLLARAREVLR